MRGTPYRPGRLPPDDLPELFDKDRHQTAKQLEDENIGVMVRGKGGSSPVEAIWASEGGLIHDDTRYHGRC